jgi:nitroimidazol reductase NimA-like FMN-containing flavoprotein (pyridoxamine 5'-phosphate oxidase superfamily)
VIEDRGYQMDKCEHAYRSVVFWGRMSIITDLDAKKHALDILFHHLEDRPDQVKERILKDDSVVENVGILRLDIEEMAGKEGK